MTQPRQWGPGLLLDAGQTPGRGASLTSSMCLLLAIKMRLIGGTTAKDNKMTSFEGTRRQLITLNKEGWHSQQPTSVARRQSPPQGPRAQAGRMAPSRPWLHTPLRQD